MHFSGSIFTLSTVIATVIAHTGPEIAAYFKTHLSKAAEVYLPSQSNYTLETTARWNAFSAPTYVISVKPASDQDVQTLVCSPPRSVIHSYNISMHLPLTFRRVDCICLP